MSERVCLLTAALGTIDHVVPPIEQDLPDGVTLDVRAFTDLTFPPRSSVMSPRLQSRIVKMFGWEMVPGYDTYIWCDASYSFRHSRSVRWVLETLDGHDLATFAHPERHTVAEEAAFVAEGLAKGKTYFTTRYRGELIAEQLAAITAEPYYVDDTLYATMVVAYRPTETVKALLREWWVHTSRYHAIDQLALPFVCQQFAATVGILPGNPYACEYLTYVRKGWPR